MSWANERRFIDDSRVRKAVLLANFGIGYDWPTWAVTSYAFYIYLRSKGMNSHGGMRIWSKVGNSYPEFASDTAKAANVAYTHAIKPTYDANETAYGNKGLKEWERLGPGSNLTKTLSVANTIKADLLVTLGNFHAQPSINALIQTGIQRAVTTYPGTGLPDKKRLLAALQANADSLEWYEGLTAWAKECGVDRFDLGLSSGADFSQLIAARQQAAATNRFPTIELEEDAPKKTKNWKSGNAWRVGRPIV